MQEVLKRHGLTLAGAQVVDFGCGTGLLTEQLVAGGAAVDAIDTSPAMLDVLDGKVAHHRWTDVTTSAELPTSAQRFDLIVCSSVCSFVDDYPGTVSNLTSLLRPGGIFVQWDWERTGDDNHGLSRDEIANALEHAGLTEITVNIAFSISVDGNTMAPLIGYGMQPRKVPPFA